MKTLLLPALFLLFLHQGSTSRELPGVESYEIVYPRKLRSVQRRSAGRNTQTKYVDKVEYGIKANGQEVVLQLQKNKDLLGRDYTETVYSDDGRQITRTPQIKDHCFYEGHVQDDAESTVSISTCQGLSGYFETRGQRYLIEPLGGWEGAEHAVYKYEALQQEPIKTCGLANNTWEQDSDDPTNDIFKSSNSPEMKEYLKAKKYLELYIVADNTLYQNHDKDVKAIRQRVFGIVNYVNTVYKARCPCRGLNFEGTTIGLAFLKSICSNLYSAGVIQDHSRNAVAVGATLAHELGHNLGMSHDSRACSCADSVCIMTDTVSPGQGVVAGPRALVVVLSQECTNDCCDPETCKLTSGSVCAHGECCENCQFKKSGAVCRAVKDDCDLAEMCSGNSASCPTDRFRVNGHPCNFGEGYCYMGKCPSRDSQCKAAFGPQATDGPASCYRLNERGAYYGYCRKEQGTHLPCKAKDTLCGKLFCSGGREMPREGSLVTVNSCKASFPKNGDDEDPGMILDGTKCGNGMVCSNGECVYTEEAFRSTNCSAKCSGHAVCDHELQCQCEEGWGPPTCDSSSAFTSIAIVVGVLAVLAVTATAAVLLIRFRVAKESHQNRSGPGATNQVFVDQEERCREPPGLAVPAQKVDGKKLLLPVPPPQENKPKLQSPALRPKGPPPPVPSTKAASSHPEKFAPERKPPHLPVPKGKPPAQALKPPMNPRV
ncbi:PREDICTED: disintegrin and metalloproteinase domain-containing protein 28 [Lepidothrix coronata]|uniref:Disintegrin and metalloproteinase domain-containing protein 28 n=1 Tax=Lepidothrix coronata TaxID=321398 RepID=A0A6J0I823_9PASS|nr:PREDICTED: disintegrin and metalloproteinase domain-containing protein 28 [Lepidothrix coronata]